MSITLYTIKTDYLRIAEELIENGGELTPELEQALTINQDQLQEKATNYAYIIMEAEYEIYMLDKEIARLQAMKKSRGNMVDRLKSNISGAMELYGVEKIESAMMKLSFRKSESVEIIDEKLIPAEYLVPQPAKISKSAIKEAIKKGETIPGAAMVTNFNLQVK